MKKIMFNDRYGLTEAVLSGRKTQTRRVEVLTEYGRPKIIDNHIVLFNDFGDVIFRKPTRYKVGEVVAIAQSYKDAGYSEITDDIYGYTRIFKDSVNKFVSSCGLTNKMFIKAEYMPHHIRITGIRFERLQDISDADCLKEGVLRSKKYAMPYGIPDAKAPNGVFFYYSTPREAYAALIDKVSGKGTWASNPYVVVYDFALVD